MAAQRSTLKLGISPCPNDTFVFHGLLSGAVRTSDVDIEIAIADVEQLNQRLLSGELEIAKASFAAALRASDRLACLSVGAALGSGVGPVVLAPATARKRTPGSPPRVLAPGEHTTATLLWRLFHREPVELEQVVFSEIMPALARGDADLGVCIHEGRFTYPDWNLRLVEDLGALWEERERCLLPLGAIFASTRLAPHVLTSVTSAIRASLAHARANPTAALTTMRAHAREHSDPVLWKHVELYVTPETERLSDSGRLAISRLTSRAHSCGITSAGALSILD